MNQTAHFECKCSFKTKFSFKKPHIVEPTRVHVECSGCKTLWFVRVKKHKEKDSVHIEQGIARLSPLLAELLKEEAEFNAAPMVDSAT